MADEVMIPSNLKSRFGELNDIAALTHSLQGRLDSINTANKSAAGTDDETATTYHKQVDAPTQDLSNLVGDIADLFGITATNGGEGADQLTQAEQDATDKAGSNWET